MQEMARFSTNTNLFSRDGKPRQEVYGVTWSISLRHNDDSSQGPLLHKYYGGSAANKKSRDKKEQPRCLFQCRANPLGFAMAFDNGIESINLAQFKSSRDFTHPLWLPENFKMLLEEADLEHGLEHVVSSSY
ncbi:hypothetical protein Tco_1503261 [Tanacetum coccineum]